MKEKVLITNKEKLTKRHKSEHESYEYDKYEVTKRSDFNQCYVAIYDIPPEKANYPYHYHTENTEAFYIIHGSGIIETPDGNYEISEGDIIICPPNASGAHRIINTSKTEVLTYIDFDTTNSPDLVHYPKTDKIGVIVHNQESRFYKKGTEVGYYDDEE